MRMYKIMRLYARVYVYVCATLCAYVLIQFVCVLNAYLISTVCTFIQDTKDKSKMESELISKWCIVP